MHQVNIHIFQVEEEKYKVRCNTPGGPNKLLRHFQKGDVLELLNKGSKPSSWWNMKTIDKLKTEKTCTPEFKMPGSHLKAVSWNTIIVLNV